jgi:hypothetical protein
VERDGDYPSTTVASLKRENRFSGLARALWLPSLTSITLPVAKFTLHGQPWMVLLVGCLPLVPYVLVAVAFTARYLLTLHTATRIVKTQAAEPLAALDSLIFWTANAPIAFLTLKPLPRSVSQSARAFRPAAEDAEPEAPHQGKEGAAETSAAPVDFPPLFWETLQAHFGNGGGVPDVISTLTSGHEQSTGRHAAPAAKL